MEGHGDMLPLMFTHDPTFDSKGNRWQEVEQWCETLGIQTTQIIYTRSSKTYCKEQSVHISTFRMVNNKAFMNARIIHDKGGAFKVEGHDIFEEDADRIELLPAAQHGELSPLDNKFNRIAKQFWASIREDTDFSFDSLLLLHCIMGVRDESISKWWRENFILDAPMPTLNLVMSHLQESPGRSHLRSSLRDMYVEAYHVYIEQQLKNS